MDAKSSSNPADSGTESPNTPSEANPLTPPQADDNPFNGNFIGFNGTADLPKQSLGIILLLFQDEGTYTVMDTITIRSL
ncbi:hypothetical protein N7490_002078 [Penicillium lividum]|nr:hypothetical protein N7490_002078 [Penicillium lividum]